MLAEFDEIIFVAILLSRSHHLSYQPSKFGGDDIVVPASLPQFSKGGSDRSFTCTHTQWEVEMVADAKY